VYSVDWRTTEDWDNDRLYAGSDVEAISSMAKWVEKHRNDTPPLFGSVSTWMIRSAWTTSSQGFKNSPSGCSMSIGRSCFLSCKAIGGECGSTPTPLFRSPTLTSEVNKEEAATEKQQ